MWQCDYADEIMDRKLFWLRVLKKFWLVAAGACVMSLLTGGSYFLYHAVLAGEKSYCAQGDIYVDYIPEEGYGISTVYLNEDVWKALVSSDAFIDDMSAGLAAQGMEIAAEELRQSVDAVLEKETRIVTVKATTPDPARSVAVASVLQQALLHYAEDYKDIGNAYVLTAVGEAQQVVTDAWTGRLFLLGALFGAAVSFTAVLLMVTLDDSVYTPEQFEHRYGIPMYGSWGSAEAEAGLGRIVQKDKPILLTAAEEDLLLEEMAETLKKAQGVGWQIRVLSDPYRQLPEGKETGGVLLVVESGRQDGKRIERLLRFLDQQACPVLGAVLWNPDQKLLKRYYGFRKGKRG